MEGRNNELILGRWAGKTCISRESDEIKRSLKESIVLDTSADMEQWEKSGEAMKSRWQRMTGNEFQCAGSKHPNIDKADIDYISPGNPIIQNDMVMKNNIIRNMERKQIAEKDEQERTQADLSAMSETKEKARKLPRSPLLSWLPPLSAAKLTRRSSV